MGDITFTKACSPARSGRPPRDTTAATLLPSLAATCKAAAAPVLAPKYPILSPLVLVSVLSQVVAASNRHECPNKTGIRCRPKCSADSPKRPATGVRQSGQ